MHDALATDRLRATDEMAIFGPHPYKRSSPLARGFPDSHGDKQKRAALVRHVRECPFPDMRSIESRVK